jgi:peptidoglycan/xylan/chitin deacetylase (PgdA/CDA1 family)
MPTCRGRAAAPAVYLSAFLGEGVEETPCMSDLGILQRAMARLSGGFVIAFHDIPPQYVTHLVDGMWPARPTQLEELVVRRKEGKSCSGLFAITVDDGVGENVRALSQVFKARGWPATFYLPTHYLDSGEPLAFQLWWRMKAHLPARKLQLKSGTLDLSRPGAIDALSRKVERMWYSERLEAYLPITLELMKVVAREMGVTGDQLEGPAPITWQEVAELGHDGLIRFESHGVSHSAMSALTEEELEFEMRKSQEIVSEHTGRPCRHLCYPFGSNRSIGTLAPKMARRFYDSAVTMNLGSIDAADPWLLPRVPLYEKNSLLFARMKILLKCTVLNRKAARSATKGTKTEIENRVGAGLRGC